MGEPVKPIEMTVDEYLEFEAKSELKHEYIDGYLRAMAGASWAHNVIAINLVATLTKQAEKRGCYLFNAYMKLKVGNTKFYYPDLLITCSPNKDEIHQEKPCFIGEILSNSTKEYDYSYKMNAYLEIDSLQSYILINQEQKEIGIFRRQMNGWHYEILKGSGKINIPCLKYKLTFDQIYNRLEFN